MIIILYNLLVKITIVPILIFFFFFHESTVPAAWLTLQTQKGTRVICHLQQEGPFLKVDMSFPSVYLFIYYYYFWCMHFGSVWIELILLKLKIENWKHCSKIIFKYMNSTVGPIFNEKLIKSEVCGVCKQYTNILFTKERVNHYGWKEKKKKKNWGNADTALINAIQTST